MEFFENQGCGSSGFHFNPENKTHGDINDSVRHVGMNWKLTLYIYNYTSDQDKFKDLLFSLN